MMIFLQELVIGNHVTYNDKVSELYYIFQLKFRRLDIFIILIKNKHFNKTVFILAFY